MKPLLVEGMHGLGDNLHQRAAIRQLLDQGYEIWLQTSWPSVYHDFPKDRLHLIAKGTRLRTQLKNAAREAAGFDGKPLPRFPKRMRLWYTPQDVRRVGSVLGAMLDRARLDPARDDFRLTVPTAWFTRCDFLLRAALADKPVMLYRPLVERKEWSGCAARNPDHDAYAAIFAAIRSRFYVVSVADLVPGQEWIVGHQIEADATFHSGELEFEALAGLATQCALVFTSPGFAVPLAQAVGPPVVCVFGGYESARSFSSGACYTPTLGIEPIQPCECFSHNHACRKEIDIPAAIARLNAFCDAHVFDRQIAA